MPLNAYKLPPYPGRFSFNTACLSTQTYDATGQLTAQQSEVFCQQKPETANADFAVFGLARPSTIPADGPQRIPFGGDMSHVPVRYPHVALPERWVALYVQVNFRTRVIRFSQYFLLTTGEKNRIY